MAHVVDGRHVGPIVLTDVNTGNTVPAAVRAYSLRDMVIVIDAIPHVAKRVDDEAYAIPADVLNGWHADLIVEFDGQASAVMYHDI